MSSSYNIHTSPLISSAARFHPVHSSYRYHSYPRNFSAFRDRIMAPVSKQHYPVGLLSLTLACASAVEDHSKSRQKDKPACHSQLKIVKHARDKFTQEISLNSKDKDISLAKALLFVAAEDEAFTDYNRILDARSFLDERNGVDSTVDTYSDCDDFEIFPLAGKTISQWLHELNVIAKEVEGELAYKDIGCDLVVVLEAVNTILFDFRSFKRFPVLVDSKFSYLHNVLSSGDGTGIMLSIIYTEVCQRLGVTIVGSRFGEDFLIWPQTENTEELFRASSGHSIFATVNGKCVKNPSSKASDLDSKSLLGLEIASNRDIIGIALANLIRLHWKRASRRSRGLMLTSPLRLLSSKGLGNLSKFNNDGLPLLRPMELRLAVMASERLLILQPHNWALRRDHGMLLYYSRRYGEAVQELSICMAFAPVEEADILEPFVEKLHLLRLESSWKSLEQAGEDRWQFHERFR